MALIDQYSNNPLIQADMQFRPQQSTEQQEPLPSRDNLKQLGIAGKLVHMGGKLPEFLKGIVTEARDRVNKAMGNENVIDVSRPLPTQLDTSRAVDALIGHESRGALEPSTSIATETGATGVSQITPLMLDHYNKLTGSDISDQDFIGDEQLQREVTSVLVNDIIKKYKTGLEDYPTKTQKLKDFKQEIKTNFNEPIYWAAGEWIAGPNWVAKLDKPTASGATETVRDYIQKVGDLYNGRNGNLGLNQ